MADNTQVQTQLTALRTLQQSYDALATASASGATAAALESAKQAILNAIAAIDMSDLAKEVTLQAVGDKLGTPATGQPSTLFAAIAAGGGSAAVPQISVPDTGSATTQELAANTLYVFSNRTSDLTLTLGEPVIGEASEYHFIVEVGSTLPTITMPTGLTWKSRETIEFDTDTTYEVSILDNYAIFVVW